MLQLDWSDADESLLLTAPTVMIVLHLRHETARQSGPSSPGARRSWSCAAGRKLQNQRLTKVQNRFRAILSCDRPSDFDGTATAPSLLYFTIAISSAPRATRRP